jgi:hypothetical protein
MMVPPPRSDWNPSRIGALENSKTVSHVLTLG